MNINADYPGCFSASLLPSFNSKYLRSYQKHIERYAMTFCRSKILGKPVLRYFTHNSVRCVREGVFASVYFSGSLKPGFYALPGKESQSPQRQYTTLDPRLREQGRWRQAPDQGMKNHPGQARQLNDYMR